MAQEKFKSHRVRSVSLVTGFHKLSTRVNFKPVIYFNNFHPCENLNFKTFHSRTNFLQASNTTSAKHTPNIIARTSITPSFPAAAAAAASKPEFPSSPSGPHHQPATEIKKLKKKHLIGERGKNALALTGTPRVLFSASRRGTAI